MKQNDFKQSEYEEFLEFKRMKQQHSRTKKPALKRIHNEEGEDTERKIIGYLIVILTILFVVLGYINKFTNEINVDSHKSISSLHYPTKEETREYMDFLEVK